MDFIRANQLNIMLFMSGIRDVISRMDVDAEKFSNRSGNYEHYCRNDRLRVVLTPDEHDLMMSDRSLDIIVPEILKDLQTEKPADGSDGQITR